MVVLKRLGACALMALCLACGGRAEQRETASKGDAAGAASQAGSSSGVAAGGTQSIAGAPAEGAAPAINGGSSAAGGSEAAGGATGVEVMTCGNGSLIHYYGGTDQPALGFSGSMDGAPLELSAMDPRSASAQLPGTVRGDVTSCRASTQFAINLQLGGADALWIAISNSVDCEASGYYAPASGDPKTFIVEVVDLTLSGWVPGWEDDRVPFVSGSLLVRIRREDGSLVHELDGKFSVESQFAICLI